MKPEFSEDGSNDRKFEGEVYSMFLKYLRESASMFYMVKFVVHYFWNALPIIENIILNSAH